MGFIFNNSFDRLRFLCKMVAMGKKEIGYSQPSIKELKKLGVEVIEIKEPIKVSKKTMRWLINFLTKKRDEEERVNKKIISGEI